MSQYAEYEIKAAYIFQFARFIEWPSGTFESDTIYLGIYKNDPFGVVLEKTMIGRKANGKDWKIIRTNNLNKLQQCHIVFFSDVQKYDLLKALAYLKSKTIITIGDEMHDFCELGGTINFTPQYSEHPFEINNEVTKSVKIKVSPKLLLLAKIISTNEDEF